MIITLKNFKCWENATFTASDSGLTLVAGNSGGGKSSIIQAVYFALYGKGTKVMRIGTSSCRVELEVAGMRIVRTKRPNRLVVNNEYEDAVAQSIINTKFGRNFDVVSYIAQDSFNSVVHMSPSARLDFLEKFAFENVDIDHVKSNLKLMLREVEDDRLKCLASVEFAKKSLDEMRVPSPVKQPSEPVTDTATIVRKLDSARRLRGKITAALEELNNNLQKIISNKQVICETKADLAQLTLDLESLGHVEDISDTERLMRAAEAYEKHMSLVTKRDTLESQYATMRDGEVAAWEAARKQLESTLWTGMSRDECLSEIRRLSDITAENQKHIEVQTQMAKLEKFYKEYREIRVFTGVHATCPECASNLSIIEGTELIPLHDHDDTKTVRASKIRAKHDKYVDLSKKKYAFTPDVDATPIQKYFDENNYNEQKLREISEFTESPTLRALGKKVRAASRAVPTTAPCNPGISATEIRDKLAAHLTTRDTHARLVDRVRAKTAILANLENESTDTVLLKSMIGDKRKHADRIGVLVETLESSLSAAAETNAAWTAYDTYTAQCAAYETARNRVITDASRLVEAEREVCDTLELKEIVARAESICLETIINTINIHAQHFLDCFFPTNPMTVTLTSHKKVTTGKSVRYKPQIDLVVQYKGTDTDVASLSGGERARVSLAFTLALSEIYHSPILMLDESISSLDHDATADVLDAIKESSQDRAVLIVSHQANTGMFDAVINI